LRPLAGCVLAGSLLGTFGCASDDFTEPTEYVDGESRLTDGGAYELVLWHSDGEPVVGYNDFLLEVLENERNHTGREITDAHINVECYMPNADHIMPVNPMVEPQLDGTYALRNINFDRAGVWQMDFDVAVEDDDPESATFTFVVD
jgi:hypothetical protein